LGVNTFYTVKLRLLIQSLLLTFGLGTVEIFDRCKDVRGGGAVLKNKNTSSNHQSINKVSLTSAWTRITCIIYGSVGHLTFRYSKAYIHSL
jgi:hypothetical protein